MKKTILNIIQFISIEPWVLLVFLVSIYVGRFMQMLMLYGIAIIHEMAHLVVARSLKIRVVKIGILSFGAVLKLEEPHIKDPIKEILIAFAGPVANILMALLSVGIQTYYLPKADNMIFFIYGNIAMASINLFPAMPLDGGRILRAACVYKMPFLKAMGICKNVTKVMIVCVLLLGVYVLYVSRLNISVLLIGVFLAFHLNHQRKEQQLIMMREFIYAKEKLLKSKVLNTHNMAVLSDIRVYEIFKYFSYNRFLIFYVINEKMEIESILTETQVIEAVKQNGCKMRMGEVLKQLTINN